MSPRLVAICKTWLVCGRKVAVRSLPVGSVVPVTLLTLKFAPFALFTATRTGEPTAMFASGESTVSPLAAAVATNTGPIVVWLPVVVSVTVKVNDGEVPA